MSVYVLWFMLYSFGGWLWELIFNRVVSKIWRWHGYLTLPLLPIYGFSALGILLFVQPYVHNPVLVFVASGVIVSLVEYLTSLVLEKVFHLKLWDYSDWPLNIKGRISIFSTLGFGFMGLVLVYVLQPMLSSVTDSLPSIAVMIVAYTMMILFILDYINSTASITRLRFETKRIIGPIAVLQHQLESGVAKIHQDRRKLRRAVDRVYDYNIRRIRKAYPRLVTIKFRKKK